MPKVKKVKLYVAPDKNHGRVWVDAEDMAERFEEYLNSDMCLGHTKYKSVIDPETMTCSTIEVPAPTVSYSTGRRNTAEDWEKLVTRTIQNFPKSCAESQNSVKLRSEGCSKMVRFLRVWLDCGWVAMAIQPSRNRTSRAASRW